MKKRVFLILSISIFFINIVYGNDIQEVKSPTQIIKETFNNNLDKNIIIKKELESKVNTLENKDKKDEFVEDKNKDILEELLNTLQNQENITNKELENLKLKNEELKKEIDKESNDNKELSKKIKENNYLIRDKEKSIKELSSQIDYYKKELFQKQLDNTKNNLLLNDLKKELEIQDKKIQEIRKERITHLMYIIFSILMIFLFLFLTNFIKYFYGIKIRKKEDRGDYKNNERIYIVFFTFVIILMGILGYFYIYQENLIYLVLTIGALLIVFRQVILSFFSSLSFLYQYKIGDIITIDDFRGKIIDIGLLSVKVLGLDEKNNLNNESIKIPNFKILEKKVKKENGKIIIDKVVIKLNSENIDKFLKLKKKIYKILSESKNTLSNIDLENQKFKETLKIDGEDFYFTYIWNDQIVNNYKIKEKILRLLIKEKIFKKEEKENKT